jgi:fructose-specific phosphotransferase system IIC component
MIPYVIFGGVLVVLALLIAFAPETASRPDPQPAWRP